MFENIKNVEDVDLSVQCTEVRFASFLSGGFTTMAVINQPERKLAKRIFVQRGRQFLLLCGSSTMELGATKQHKSLSY